MARLSTVTAIAISSALLAPLVGHAQSNQEAPASQSRQLTKTPRDDPPAEAPVTIPPAPPAAPLAASPAAAPVAAPPVVAPVAPPLAAPAVAILCDGGTATGSTCVCPAGYTLLQATTGGGGTCVRSNAENCRGGVLTVAGVCLCDGRVTMSGETYALEFLGGKCVPKRCPDRSYLREGQCVASNDTRFSFTCRTGYVPDDAVSITPAAGLRCVPDPTFCPGETKRKDGTCFKSSAIAIDCFEGRCSCGPNADWANYLCQCTAPYRNVNGACVTTSTASVDEKGKPELQSAEPSPRRKACPRGTVRAQSGNCVAARPSLPSAGELGVYYERAQRYQGYPVPQPDNLR